MLLGIGIPALVVVLLLAFCIFVGNYFYNFALLRRPQGESSPAVEANYPEGGMGGGSADVSQSLFSAGEEFKKAVDYEDAYIEAFDGLRLHGYFIGAPEGSERYAVVCHGYHSSADTMFGFAERFYAMGYGVLLPDARGHGQSEGGYVGMGWHERLDIADWSAWLAAREPDCRIALFGVSMGGATVMMAAGEALPENVRAVVEDCGYSSIRAEFAYQLETLFHLPSFPALHLAGLTAKLRAGYNFMKEGDAAAQVAKSELPILFIHGDSDDFVPSDMVYTVYEAAAGEKALLVVEGAAHGMASAADPEAYWAAVETFLARWM